MSYNIERSRRVAMDFKFEEVYQLGKDATRYDKISSEYVAVTHVEGRNVLKISPEALSFLAKEAFRSISFFYRKTHLENLRKIVLDPEASENDHYVARNLLENAVESAKGLLPGCQDTGTAIVVGKKGQNVWTDVNDRELLSKGIFEVYQKENLRYSQMAPLSMFEEKNTRNNLPAQIDLYATQGDEYHFLFIAKGGGSANKTRLFQKTKALLNEDSLYNFLVDEIEKIGTSACPPYYLTVVVGGTSAEENVKMVKLASTEYYDGLPTEGSPSGRAYRDIEWEKKVLEIAQRTGIGAQFGGKYLAHRAIVVRLPRHGASCPVGIGVSCSAHRNIKAKITGEGIFLEHLETNPETYLKDLPQESERPNTVVKVDLEKPMEETLKELSKYPVGTKLSLSGHLIVARDIAHAKINDLLKAGKPLPEYFKQYPIYYAGPAKTPEGMHAGSFGPTTANRMDPYLDIFMPLGGSMISIGKGNRTPEAIETIKTYKGFYLGSIGGGAAFLTKNSIAKMELLDFGDQGMEAIQKITVVDFPAIIIYDDKGNSLYQL